ncbi:hypothetical protein [Sporosarcina sp. FSL K6-5500]|uniref:hypothetical protein n=1 Tax=Sporosarcina sp. FSL K6-5500 TaxID=2921558 RepID=UPI0030FA157B
MKIGRKIYYDKATGNIVLDTGERQGDVIETTIEQDIAAYTALSERNRGTFDVLELEYGQYAQEFAESNGYRVNPETKILEFSYPNPNEPEAPQEFRKPLSQEVEELKLAQTETDSTVLELMELVLLGGM